MTVEGEASRFYGFEVCLDNGYQVNIVHPRFLTGVKQGSRSFKGANKNTKSTKTTQVGHLEGFHEFIASRDVRISIISQHDVEKQ